MTPSRRSPRSRRALRLKVMGATALLAATIVAAAAVGLPAPTSTNGASASPSGCPEIILYFSRGSGQPIGPTAQRGDARGLANPGLQLYRALTAQYGTAAVGSISNAYPAVKLSWRLIHTSRVYGPSVVAGRRSLKRNVADLIALCPQSTLVLGGFSQGAELTHSALSELGEQEQKHVAAVVLFGDPLFAAGEANVTAEQSREAAADFKPGRRGMRFFVVRPQPLAGSYSGKVFSWCHGFDIVCQGLGIRNFFKSQKTYAEDIPSVMAKVGERLRALGILPSSMAPTPYIHRVVGTCHDGTCGLAEWSGPGMANFQAFGALHDEQTVSITCQATGQSITGSSGGSSAIWDRLSDGAFVPDYYIDTPNYGVYSPPIPQCRALAVAGP
jgi:hypothetical protein